MKEKKTNKIMERVDSLLKERNITQRELCNAIGISSPALSGLRKTNGMPSADTALKLSSYFSVSPEWLITGEIVLPESFDSRPAVIIDRIDNLLNKDKNEQSDHFKTFSIIHETFGPILHIVSLIDILNWHYDRCFPEIEKLLLLAKFFNTSFEYVVYGYEQTEEIKKNNDNAKIVPKDEYDYYKNYEKYKTLFWSFDAMYEPDKKYIAQLIRRLFRLRRFAEGRDYDNAYNLEHPLEEPRQKDPNISDEEYDEIYKKSRNGL